jgi:rSAM/selenodomain-associated transferase 2
MLRQVISVVIPTLNAGVYLPRALAPLVAGAASGLVKQVIVCDGGSSDETLVIADAAGCDIVRGARGRGVQLIAGAAAAKADWFLFLHADTALGEAWLDDASRFIASGDDCAAAFTLAFDDSAFGARWVAFWARQRAGLLKLPYGDQGLLISKTLYNAIGGYRDLPLMEDLDIVRRIGGGRLRILPAKAVTSADKYRRDGYANRSWRNLALAARYLMGADPAKLAKLYD